MGMLEADAMLEHAHRVTRPAYPGPAGRRSEPRRRRRSTSPAAAGPNEDAPMHDATATPSHPSQNPEDTHIQGAEPAGADELRSDAGDIDWAAVGEALAAASHLHAPRDIDTELDPPEHQGEGEDEDGTADDGEESEREEGDEGDHEAAFWDDILAAEMDLEIDDDGTSTLYCLLSGAEACCVLNRHPAHAV
jgi:hypothetical protein